MAGRSSPNRQRVRAMLPNQLPDGRPVTWTKVGDYFHGVTHGPVGSFPPPPDVEPKREPMPASNCSTCAFFVPGDVGVTYGQCHRNAPVPFMASAGHATRIPQVISMWPTVDGEQWCGEFAICFDECDDEDYDE